MADGVMLLWYWWSFLRRFLNSLCSVWAVLNSPFLPNSNFDDAAIMSFAHRLTWCYTKYDCIFGEKFNFITIHNRTVYYLFCRNCINRRLWNTSAGCEISDSMPTKTIEIIRYTWVNVFFMYTDEYITHTRRYWAQVYQEQLKYDLFHFEKMFVYFLISMYCQHIGGSITLRFFPIPLLAQKFTISND